MALCATLSACAPLRPAEWAMVCVSCPPIQPFPANMTWDWSGGHRRSSVVGLYLLRRRSDAPAPSDERDGHWLEDRVKSACNGCARAGRYCHSRDMKPLEKLHTR